MIDMLLTDHDLRIYCATCGAYIYSEDANSHGGELICNGCYYEAVDAEEENDGGI